MRLVCAALLVLLACDGSEPATRPPSATPSAQPREAAEAETPRTLGGLRVRMLGGEDGRGGGDGPVVVLLHGYGAAGDDLVPLARELDLPEGTRLVVPEAPIDLGGSGRAWWRLDVDRLRNAEERDLSGEVPEGMPAAREKVTALVREAERELGVERSRLVLVGFSQGAMLALDVALHLDPPPAGVAALSGTLVSEAQWVPLAEARPDLAVLVSHGRRDPLLPFRMAEALRDRLEAAGASVRWVPFDGGHTIPPEVRRELERFLADAL